MDRSHYHLLAIPRLLPIVAAAVIGVSLSLATYFAIAVREHVVKEQDFTIKAANLVSTLQTGLDKYLEEVVALRALFNSSGGEVSRGGFEICADRRLQAQPAILSVSWIPRVNRDERAMHELAAARDGLADYHINSIAADVSIAISPQQDEYYPKRVTPSDATAWSLLVAGLMVTAICAAFMWSSRRHADSLIRVTQKVSELAQADALTSLANRRAFLDRLAGAFAASERNEGPFAMFFIDLDHFKDVNDTLGHAAGDMLLRGVAERLRTSVRRTDFMARTGDDEFAVLLQGAVDIAATGALAAKMIETLALPYSIDGNELRVTASIGISHSSAEFSQPKAMMVQADLALYRAKENGRNCFSFPDAEVDQLIRERVTLGNELRVAIEHHELELFYQPQVEISSGNIAGVEALVRWNHPKHGLIAPSIFIPIAEKTGVITLLGKWVFDQACRQAKIWQDEGIAPKAVGVNVSALQCSRSDIVKDVAESLARWNVEPATMEIELTESVLMEVTQQHCDIIGRLRKLGLRIAIDDFGTGYSSLSYLTNYPVDRLKIARELVLHVSTNCRHASVVRTAIRLAHELDIEVIAEGVETDAQAHFLISADCAYAQGYYYSRPVTVERATTLLREGILKPCEQPQRSSGLAAA